MVYAVFIAKLCGQRVASLFDDFDILAVKWFNMQKGYGFIAPENGGADVFVHITAVEKAGFRTLNENEKIAYDLLSEKGKTSAGNLRKA